MTVNTDFTVDTFGSNGVVLIDPDPRRLDTWEPTPDGPVNEPLIRLVLAFIEMHEERWNQDVFVSRSPCGTVGCFAGWALLLNEYDDLEVIDTNYSPLREVALTQNRARTVLGLSVDQFYRIFTFVNVHDKQTPDLRHPTFSELCERVKQVTGIDYKAPLEIELEIDGP